MEIANVKYEKKATRRLALESIDDSETEFRFVWRGNKSSKDGFIDCPAKFEWEILGKLIRKGFNSGKIKEEDIFDFLRNFIDLKEKK